MAASLCCLLVCLRPLASQLFASAHGAIEQTPTRDQIANALTHSEGKIRHDSSIKALFPVA